MEEIDDFAIALRLQEEFDRQAAADLDGRDSDSEATGNDPNGHVDIQLAFGDHGSVEGMSLVDERWETLDPNPDVRALFLEFNDRYFWGRLAGVEVRWSPRMTL